MTDLRECPFCGGEAEVMVGYHARTDAKVGCVACSAEGPLFGSNDHSGGDHQAEAIAAWNRRASDRYTLTDAGRAHLEGK